MKWIKKIIKELIMKSKEVIEIAKRIEFLNLYHIKFMKLMRN